MPLNVLQTVNNVHVQKVDSTTGTVVCRDAAVTNSHVTLLVNVSVVETHQTINAKQNTDNTASIKNA